MKRPRAIAMILAAALVAGEMGGVGLSVSASEYDAEMNPVVDELIQDAGFIQDEAEPEIHGSCYTITDGVMYLSGNVVRDELLELQGKDNVTSIIALEGTVLPYNCDQLFKGFDKCISIDLSKANTSAVGDMTAMFSECIALTDVNLSGLDTSNVWCMRNLFKGCISLQKVDVSQFDTTNVTDIAGMFSDCWSMQSIDVSNFDTSKVIDMNNMFARCSSIKSLDLGNFDTQNVFNMNGMFCYCDLLEELDISGFKTEKVEDFETMFMSCISLKNLDLGHFDTHSATQMAAMFLGSYSLEELNVSSFNTANVRTMTAMFSGCYNLKNLDVSGFDTSNVTDMSYMFSDCDQLKTLDLHSFIITENMKYEGMFDSMVGLETLILGENIPAISTEMCLNNNTFTNNGYGWSRGDTDGTRISGDGEYAYIENDGVNTYHKRLGLKGLLAIQGGLAYGKTLTAVVEEPNSTNLAYQWKRNGTNISGANENTYKLTKDDIYYVIACEITSKDPWILNSIEGATVKEVDKAQGPGAPKGVTPISPTKKGAGDGQIQGVDTTMEYATNLQFTDSIQCTGNTIEGLKAGNYYVRIKETDTTYAGIAKKVVVEDPNEVALTGKVKISGVLRYDENLKAQVSESNATKFTYQWKRNGKAISGATNATYRTVKADIGKVLSCEVTDATGTFTKSITAKTQKIGKAFGPDAPTGLTPVEATLKGKNDGKITGVDTTMEYATKQDFSDAINCKSTTITGLTAGTYYVRVKETDIREAGITAKVTVTVKEGLKKELIGTVTIKGNLKYDQTLVATVTGSNAKKFAYRWKRGNTVINKANSPKYKLVKEDIGQTITCIVTDATDTYTGSISATTTIKVEKMDGPAAPENLEVVAPTKKGAANGMILGVDATMECATKADFSNAKACKSNAIKGLKAGTYYVRVKETETNYAGKAATVKVPQGESSTPIPTPTPKPKKKEVTKAFKDVAEQQWYVDALQFVYDNSIMNGTSDVTFDPLKTLTRGEFVTVLYNMEERPEVTFASNTFKDIKEKDFYALPVIWAAQNDITSGIGGKQFGPNKNITREQLAVMLYQFAKSKNYKTEFDPSALDNFPDKENVSSWATEAMQWAVSNKIIGGKAGKGKANKTDKADKTGKEDNNEKEVNILDPSGQATRAECAQMIKNLCDNVK